MTDRQKHAIQFIERTLNVKYDGRVNAYNFIGKYLVKAQLQENRSELERLRKACENAKPPVWTLSGARGPDPDRIDTYEYAGQRYPNGTLDFTPHFNQIDT